MALRIIKCDEQNDVLFKKISVDDYCSSTAIVVPETHNAIIVKDGIAFDTLASGKHFIFDKKNGILANIVDSKEYIDVIFISKTTKLNIYWGTTTQWNMRDPITDISIKLGASGEFEVQISNPRKAYLELIGNKESFDVDELRDRLLGRLLAEVQFQIANIMHEKQLSYDRFGEVLLPISKEILPHVQKMFDDDYGLQIFSFTISNIVIDQGEIDRISEAKASISSHKAKLVEIEAKEKHDEKEFNRNLDLRRLEVEDYAKYLEVCKIVGWPSNNKKAGATEENSCFSCGARLLKESKFCPVCGVELLKQKIKCPNCNKLVNKSDLFCKHCGAKIGG